MKISAKEIVAIVKGEFSGSGDQLITGVAPLETAGTEDLSFVMNEKYIKLLPESKAGLIFVKKGTNVSGKTLIFVDDPQFAFLQILQIVAKEKEEKPSGIHPTAVVSKDAKIGSKVSIGPNAVIESEAVIGDNCSIGAQCYIGKKVSVGNQCKFYPQVTIREEVIIHDRVIIHSGTVVGSDGYGYAFKNGVHHKIPQIGTVEIFDDVEIGANVAIDRAAMGKTVIGKGTKVDNLVQIAHNVQIGEGCLLVSQAGISGSTKLGKYVTLAGQVGVSGHITIGDGVIAAAQSGIPNNVPAGTVVFGTPARPIQEERKIQVIIGKLPKIYEEFRKIKKLVKLD